MLAPCQVKEGDGSGLIQGSPFISNQESKRPLLTAYCFRISGCNASGRQNTDETGAVGPPFIMRLMQLNCHPTPKPAEATVYCQLGLQMKYRQSTPLAGDEQIPFPLLYAF